MWYKVLAGSDGMVWYKVLITAFIFKHIVSVTSLRGYQSKTESSYQKWRAE